MKTTFVYLTILVLVFLVLYADASPGGRTKGKGPGRHDHGHDHGTGDRGMGGQNGRDVTTTLAPGRCTKIVSAIVSTTQTYKASRRVATHTRCGWTHLAKCRKYRIQYFVGYRTVTKRVQVKVHKCCPGFMEVNGVCEPLGGRTMPPTPPPTTVTTPPPIPTTTDRMPDDDMMMVDDTLQKFIAFLIVIVAVLVFGCFIGGVVVYCCGGRKEVIHVIRRMTTRKFAGKSRKGDTRNDKGNKSGKKSCKTPSDAPPRYDEHCKHTPHHHDNPSSKVYENHIDATAPPYDEGYDAMEIGHCASSTKSTSKSGKKTCPN